MRKIRLPKVEIAKSMKVPYASKSLNIPKSECYPHKHMHGELYYVKSFRFVTYFYSKNNLIFYKRNQLMSFFEIVPDFINGSYEFFEFNDIRGRLMDQGKVVARTGNGNWLLIAQVVELQDNKRYIAALNISQNIGLLLASKDNEIYSRFLPIMANRIMPIIQFKKDGIFIYLIDMSNEIVHFIEWRTADIKKLIIEVLETCQAPNNIISEVNREKIIHFHDIEIGEITGYLSYHTHGIRKLHVYAIEIIINDISMIGTIYDYTLSKFAIDLLLSEDISEDTVSVYWHYRQTYPRGDLYILRKNVIDKFPKSEEDIIFHVRDGLNNLSELGSKLLTKDVKFNAKSKDVYIINEIYRDDFRYIMQDYYGIKFITCDEPQDFYLDYHTVSVYRYKRYIFMINYHSNIKLEVIDVHNNLSVSFKVDADIHNTTEQKLLFHFYPIESYKKVLFLHVQLRFMFVLDLIELEHIFDDLYARKDSIKCGKHIVREAKTLLKIFELEDLVIHAITKHSPYDGKIGDINIISHYLDYRHTKLYILAKYWYNNSRITGLFVWDAASSDNRLSVFQYSIDKGTNVALKVEVGAIKLYNQYFKISRKIDLYNLDLHKTEYRNRKLVDSDILFNTKNCFVSVKYNRMSLPILMMDGTRAEFRVENIRNFLFLSSSYFGIRDEDDWETDIDFSSCFILSELSLASQIFTLDF